MGRMTIDWSGSSIVPPGDYLVDVQRVKLCDKNDGTGQFLRLDLLVVEGRHAGACFDTVVTLDPDLFGKFSVPMLEALGVDLSGGFEIDYEDDFDREVTQPDLVGRRAVAEVIHREFGGQTYVRVRRLRRPEPEA